MRTPIGSFDHYVGIEYSNVESARMGKDIWVTREEFTFTIGAKDEMRWVTVPKGFFTDGASVPRMFWWLFPPWGVYGQAAIVHDFLCIHRELTNNGFSGSRFVGIDEIDRIFYQAMKTAGTPVWTRAIIYGCVRLFHNLGFE